jgi:hypothetical protein
MSATTSGRSLACSATIHARSPAGTPHSADTALLAAADVVANAIVKLMASIS